MSISRIRPASAFEVAWRGVSTEDLAGEAAARAAADAALQAAIDAEEARAEAAEAALAADITVARSELLTEPAVSELASLWSSVVVGEPKTRSEIAASSVVFDGADGLVIRVTGAAVRAPRISYRMVPGHKYEVLAMARRETDPHDSAGNTVSLQATWLSASKASLGSTTVESFALLGSSMHLYRKVVSTVAGSEVDFVAAANTVYFTPFIRTLGTDGVTNILPYIRVTDLTSNTLISADISGLDARLDALESANLDTRLSNVEALVAGTEIARFKTRGDAAAATIPAAVDMVETLSYATDGDAGGGRYKRIAGPSTSLGDFQSAGGLWWEHAPAYGPLRFSEWGVTGDGSVSGTGVWSGTDQEPKIKAGFYRYAYQLKGTAAELPIGILFLGRGIHLGYGDQLRSGRLKGAWKGYQYQSYPGTTLAWNFTDEPLLSIQGVRNTLVEDIAFSGPGLDRLIDTGIGSIPYDGAAGDDVLLATWADPAWPAQASSRYAPAAIIAIDPRVGPADATNHYRDVSYPTEMGAVTQYSKAISSSVTIKNIDVYGGGMVAVVVHPNINSDGNGDFVRIKDSRITYAPVGLSIGQTQARLTLLDSVDFNRNHTAITTVLHGKQQGVFAEARNCHFNGIQIFDFGDTSVAGHITINGYGEEMWRIGDVLSASSAATKLVLHQLKLSFDGQYVTGRGVPATMIGGSGLMPLEINGGSWTNYKGAAVIDKTVSGVSIEGLFMNPTAPTGTAAEIMSGKCFLNGTAGGLIFPQLGFGLPIDGIRPKFTPWNLDTGAASNARMLGRRWPSSRVICTPLWVERHGAQTLRDEGVLIPERVGAAVSGSTFTGASLSGLTLTTTWTGRTDKDYMIFGPLPGDVLYHTASKSVFVCMTANTTTDVVTFRLVNNYRGTTTTPRNPIDFVTDTLCYLGCLRYYSPNAPVYGIITAGSAIITEAGSLPNGGGTQAATALDPDIAVGDWLVVDPSLAPYLNQTLCRVKNIDETAKTITLSNSLDVDGPAIGSTTYIPVIPTVTVPATPPVAVPLRVRLGTWVRPGVS